MDFRPGLEGVIAAETSLSLIDGEAGKLLYRGLPAGELAGKRSFEEVAHFLWSGVSDEHAREAFCKHRELPSFLKKLLDGLPVDMGMMESLRTAVSALGSGAGWPPTPEEALALTSVVPTILAYRWRRVNGLAPVSPDGELGHAANYLYMLTGERPKPAHAEALEAYMVLTMEHGLNASTFAARVITSTQSDLYSAVTGAVGAMKGPLHGGAPTGVVRMLDAIGTQANAERWLRETLERGERLMGFGHRVYKTRDPRAVALREVTERLAGDDPWFALAIDVEREATRLLEEYKPGRRLYANVEFYAAAVLRAVALPEALFTPTFSAARTVGWTGHVLEQASCNRIFRPKARYVN
ncbi:MAG TPA: citrate synthase/methylcitrate synthase [Bacillales bacterium]|nr:citrate synthase/methylcitrate synthase [Bacillales bacterium]